MKHQNGSIAKHIIENDEIPVADLIISDSRNNTIIGNSDRILLHSNTQPIELRETCIILRTPNQVTLAPTKDDQARSGVKQITIIRS